MLLKRTVTAVKVVYFTIFYIKITHADRIAPELQEELADYLKMGGDTEPRAEVETEAA
ncbi:MAG: hypothetical protein ACOCV2_08260 [Persicimonas sp.]